MHLFTAAAMLLSCTTVLAADAVADKKKPVCPCVTVTKTAAPTSKECACPAIFCEPTPSSERCHTTITSWVPEVNPYCSTATTTYTPCDCPNLSNCGCLKTVSNAG